MSAEVTSETTNKTRGIEVPASELKALLGLDQDTDYRLEFASHDRAWATQGNKGRVWIYATERIA